MKKVKITSLDQQEFTLISVLSGRILKMKSTIELFFARNCGEKKIIIGSGYS